MNYWEIVHAYRRLASAGKVGYFRCVDDDTELVPVLNPEHPDIPSLRCIACLSVVNLGTDTLESMRKAVDSNHFNS